MRSRPHLERSVALVVSGGVRVAQITQCPLAQAAGAHRASVGRQPRGKPVLTAR